MESIQKKLAKNLRRIRLEVGLTQEELAARSNLHRTYIGALERCERNVSIRNLERLAKSLNVDAVELIKGETDYES